MRGARGKVRKPTDPYMQDIPYDIIYDEKGKVLAEVYLLPFQQLKEGKPNKQKMVRKQ